jgi:glucokinase
MREALPNVKSVNAIDNTAMLLAGDIGGTKTLLGLFTSKPDRPSAIDVGEFRTLEYPALEPMVESFLASRQVESRHIEAATFGAAGAVTDDVARLTNVPWQIDCAAVSRRLGFKRTHVLNDLEALAHGVTVLEDHELTTLQRGTPRSTGNAAVIAAGTGLGEAMLHNVHGRLVPGASEGGHADFAPRTRREIDMLLELMRHFPRVSVETILSGPGLVNVYQFTHQTFAGGAISVLDRIAPGQLCPAVGTVADPADLPAAISKVAMDRDCPHCVEALDIFVSVYGAESGNIALRSVATAGVYVGGGIAPKILPALESGLFLEAFRAKAPMADYVAAIPVAVILNPDAGLLGAAVHAQQAAAGL